jgi:class 3 adenylate cyclase
MPSCPDCGTSNPDAARFCSDCGRPLAVAVAEPGSRRLVTVLFVDLVGSTALGERLDPEALRGLLDRYFAAMSGILVAHGGSLEKYIGDAIVAVFGLPRQREDDAHRAVRAGLAMQAAVAAMGDELHSAFGVAVAARVGIESGEVASGASAAGQRLVTGDIVNVAARLQAVAPPGGVVVGPQAASLVRSAFELGPADPLMLKGKAERVRARQVLREHGDLATGVDGPFVGRDAELEVIAAAHREVRDGRVPRLLLVVGDAGLGKTRLVEEALSRIDSGTRVVGARCSSSGAGATFAPVAAIVGALADVRDETPENETRARLAAAVARAPDGARLADRLGSLLGLRAGVGLASELALAVRALLEAAAERRPLVVLLEDLHWAEAGLLELLHDVVSDARGPILLIATARPVLLEEHPGWPDLPERATRLVLRPLSGAEARRVLAGVLGGELPRDLGERLEAAAEGNPLFLAQLVASLVDEGRLVHERGTWRLATTLEQLELPNSIRALLGARLEQLGQGDRGLVEGASVAGVVFSLGAVRLLAPEPVRAAVTERLADLERRDWVRPVPEGHLGESAYRFGHALIRDAAYAGTAKSARAELHLRFADWLTSGAAARLPEVDEVVGHHLAEAWRYRVELRPGEDHEPVARRAVAHLAAAGRRAFDRGDMPGAVGLLTRAHGLLPPGHRARLALVPVLGKAYLESARNDELHGYLAEVSPEARAAGDQTAHAHARVLEGFLLVWSGTAADPDRADRLALAAGAVFEAAGDERGLARVDLLLAEIALGRARMRDAVGHWADAAAHADRSGDAWEISEARSMTAVREFGLGAPLESAERATRELMAAAEGDPIIVFRCLLWLARYSAMRDELPTARAATDEARRFEDRLRMPIWRAELDQIAALLELQHGEPDAAERMLSPYLGADGTAQAHWSQGTAALGAWAAAEQGRVGPARALLARSALLEGSDVFARTLHAEAIVHTLVHVADPAARGVALELVREADAIDALGVEADARLALATACLAGGDLVAASRWARDAEARFAARGMAARAAAARALVRGEACVTGAPRAPDQGARRDGVGPIR